MRLLIAIKSCRRDCYNGFNQAIRDTWLQNCPVDHAFFVGGGDATIWADEVVLDCGDGYLDLPWKLQAICAWALARDYDFVFVVDTDTYVDVKKLLESGFENSDVTSTRYYPEPLPGVRIKHNFVEPPHPYDDAAYFQNPKFKHRAVYSWPGTATYWISRRLMNAVVQRTPDLWAEDMWLGQIIGEGIESGQFLAATHDGYSNDDGAITSHYKSTINGRPFDVNWMYEKHKNRSC